MARGISLTSRRPKSPASKQPCASSPFATQGARDRGCDLSVYVYSSDPGDYNGDGVVDGRDLANWKAGFGTTGNATRTARRRRRDLDVDGADFFVWQRHVGSGPNSTGASIPEPTALVILVTGVLAIVSLRRYSERKKMTNWQAWMACGLLMSLPAAAQADIFRWDNGQLIPGTEGITPGPGVDLSEWSSPERNLGFADFTAAWTLLRRALLIVGSIILGSTAPI